MTKGQIESWYRQSKTMLNVCLQMEEQLDTLQGHKALTKASGNRKQRDQMDEQFEGATAEQQKLLEVLLERTHARDLENAKERLYDLELKLGHADQRYQEWRTKLMQLEFAATMGEFAESEDDGVTRAQAEAVVSQLQARYETALKLADDAVPNVARLIRV